MFLGPKDQHPSVDESFLDGVHGKKDKLKHGKWEVKKLLYLPD